MPWITTRDRTDVLVKDWGDRSGRPVILIHGHPLNASSFDRLAMELAEAGPRRVPHRSLERPLGQGGRP